MCSSICGMLKLGSYIEHIFVLVFITSLHKLWSFFWKNLYLYTHFFFLSVTKEPVDIPNKKVWWPIRVQSITNMTISLLSFLVTKFFFFIYIYSYIYKWGGVIIWFSFQHIIGLEFCLGYSSLFSFRFLTFCYSSFLFHFFGGAGKDFDVTFFFVHFSFNFFL